MLLTGSLHVFAQLLPTKTSALSELSSKSNPLGVDPVALPQVDIVTLFYLLILFQQFLTCVHSSLGPSCSCQFTLCLGSLHSGSGLPLLRAVGSYSSLSYPFQTEFFPLIFCVCMPLYVSTFPIRSKILDF